MEHEIISAYAERPRGKRICSGVLRPRDILSPEDVASPPLVTLKVIPSPEEGAPPEVCELVLTPLKFELIVGSDGRGEGFTGPGNVTFDSPSAVDPWHHMPVHRMVAAARAATTLSSPTATSSSATTSPPPPGPSRHRQWRRPWLSRSDGRTSAGSLHGLVGGCQDGPPAKPRIPSRAAGMSGGGRGRHMPGLARRESVGVAAWDEAEAAYARAGAAHPDVPCGRP